jgi:hypothetical protein
MLLTCEEKYANYKIRKTPVDADYQKSDALALGSAVHWILEASKHEKPASITKDLAICVRDPTIGLPEEAVPLAHAMVLRYLRLHKDMGLKVLAVEIKIEIEGFLGYVDAVMEDAEGNWHIVDVKTWKSLTDAVLRQLPKDAQMGLYASQFEYVANLLGLLPEKFAGIRWRVISKSTTKQKKGEAYADYVLRLVEAVRAYDLFIPRAKLDWTERLQIHRKLWEKSARLRSGEDTPIKNFKSCFDFYSPCEFFSRCHGSLFSESHGVEVTEG